MFCVCESTGPRPGFPPALHTWPLHLASFVTFPLQVPPVCCSCDPQWGWWWHLLLGTFIGEGNFQRILSAVTELLKVQFFGVLAESFGFSINNGND